MKANSLWRKRIIALVAFSLVIMTGLWIWFALAPLPNQFVVYLSLPAGCKVVGEDLILTSNNKFYAAPGDRMVTIVCDGTTYVARLTVRRGDNHASWSKGEAQIHSGVE